LSASLGPFKKLYKEFFYQLIGILKTLQGYVPGALI